MRFAATIEVSPATGARMDAQPGGPGPAIRQLMEQFQPDSCWVALDRRAMFVVADFPSEREIAAFMAFVSKWFETYPVMTPVVDVREFAGISRHIAETVHDKAQ
jgi:hypothetical protein